MTTLTKADKLQLINSHMRSLEYSKYGLELDLMQENAKTNKSQEEISRIQGIIDDTDGQLDALQAELTKVNALTE
mgnify:CR=1 FL=1